MKNDKFGPKEAKEYLNSKYPGMEEVSSKWVDGKGYSGIQRYSSPEAMDEGFISRILDLCGKLNFLGRKD